MDTRRRALTALLGVVLSAGAVAACMPQPGMEAKSPAVASATAAASATAPKAEPPPGKAPPLPKTMAECKAMAQRPLAGHGAKSVGGSDPQRQFDDLFDAQHETFRCCFDMLFAPEAPRRDGHVALLVKVDFTGKLASSEIVAADSNVQLPEVQACVLEVARGLAYPPPANDQDVAYERVFDFKARR